MRKNIFSGVVVDAFFAIAISQVVLALGWAFIEMTKTIGPVFCMFLLICCVFSWLRIMRSTFL